MLPETAKRKAKPTIFGENRVEKEKATKEEGKGKTDNKATKGIPKTKPQTRTHEIEVNAEISLRVEAVPRPTSKYNA